MLAGALVSLLTTAAVLLPGPRSGLAGLSIDSLFWLRQKVFGSRHDPAQSPVSLIVIDEQTYATEPFRGTPAVLWTPYLATVLRAVLDAGPATIGVDLILPTSVEGFLPGYDREFLRVLRAGASAGKLVLGKVQGQGPPISPYAGQIMAVGGGDNVRSTNQPEDADGIVRRLDSAFPTGEHGREASFGLELAARAAGLTAGSAARDFGLDGREPLLNFDGGAAFPTYSLADLYGCAKAEGGGFFKRQFAGKVVLLGTLLDVEDRKLTSRRLINEPERITGPRCGPEPAAVPADVAVRPPFARATLPGVFIHATAIQNMLEHEVAWQLGGGGRVLAILLVAVIAAAMAIKLRLRLAIAAVVGLTLLCVLVPTLLFRLGPALPMLEMTVAAIGSFLLMLAYRYAVADRDRRLIRAMFNLYLSPSLVDGMLAQNRLPSLGGDRRTVTIFFSDIANFTTLSERSDPSILAPLLNQYFDGVCDIILGQGGLVVEFLGDGVLALFNAPAEQADHAARGVRAARLVDDFSERFRIMEAPAFLGFGATRIGVHTGQAIVGNFGSTRRLKYAAMGDAVNTASRIEGLNKFFGTRVCISGEVWRRSDDPDVRPLGSVRLKGKDNAVEIFELLGAGAAQLPATLSYVAAFDALRRGDPDAEHRFAALAAAAPEDAGVLFQLRRIAAGDRSELIVMADK